MDVVKILAQMGISTSVDFEQPLSPQIRALLSSVRDTPYSALVTNVLLVVLAIAIVIAGIGVGWIAAHPDRSRVYIRRLRARPWLIRLEQRYRGWIEFLVCRFTPRGAYGLSFTTGLVALVLSLWAFGGVLEDVVAHNETFYLDAPIVVHIAAHRIGWLTTVMRALTLLGTGWCVLPLAAIVGLVLRYQTKSWRPLLLLAATVAGAGLLDYIFKITVARPRPLPEWMAAPATGYAFPSGHAAFSATYGALAYLLAKTRRHWQSKVAVWTTASTIVLLIGISRVYLGVHWPTDVLGGWTLAAVWLSILFTAASVIEQTRGAAYSLAGAAMESAAPPESDISAPGTLFPISRQFIPGPGGLSEAQVQERIARGQINVTQRQSSRSVAHILTANIFTRFNALLGGLLVVILLVGPAQDALFGLIIIVNTAIGIIQELRAKWTLDRLVLITAQRARVRRSDEVQEVPTGQIVLDDVIELHSGDQVPVDGVVLRSNHAEIDESLLTGESEPIAKEAGAEIYSGSFAVAGDCQIQAVRVGEQAYARRLARAARTFALAHSELREGINRFLRYITWLLVPTAVLLVITQLLYTQGGWRDAIGGAVAGVVGMVPEGLVLLTSVVMAAAVVRLAHQNALIQELAAVEMLARVDVLCLDKTGTLTEGKMVLDQIIQAPHLTGMIAGELPCHPTDVLGMFAQVESHPNASLLAIALACPPPSGESWSVKGTIPFSSARKWSAVIFDRYGTWVLGAPEIVLSNLDPTAPLWTEVTQQTERGRRVLALAYTKDPLPQPSDSHSISLPAVTPAALVILSEQLRQDVAQTLTYFKDQGVAIKVISGDNPRTVGAIAAGAGVPGADSPQDGRKLPTDLDTLGEALKRSSVFGRVTPEQKRLMVQALQRQGHIVAMTGDGVNDVLAIKEADFGIAMGSGTDATRAIAQLILLSSSFAALPGVIAEGRRVIANIERTANLFLTKTVYVFALALAVGAAQVPFPFLPRHLTLVGFLTIGTPALFLSLARNTTRARRGFVSRVLRFAIPAGGFTAAATLLAYALTRQLAPMDVSLARTAATLTLVGCGLSVLLLLARPVTLWQRLFMAALIGTLGVIFAHPWLRAFFALTFPPAPIWGMIVILAIACFVALRAAWLNLLGGKRMSRMR
jgi:cation-transporting ATPase E